MANDLIVVFGGAGFIGRHVVRALAKRGKRIRVPMRRPHLAPELRVLGDVGQIQLVQANVRFPESVDAAMEGAAGAVNLVAALYEHGNQNFQALHVEGARAIAEAAKRHGVERLVHVSALGAAPKGARYARTKFAGEAAVREAVPAATVLRPSIVFGPEDGFFNRFARMATISPVLPLIGGGKTRFQPVYVGDVAEAICNALDRADARGRTYELGGPSVYTFKQLMQFVTAVIDRPRPLVSIPFVFAHPLGLLAEWSFKLNPWADPPLTGDQVTMLRRDNVVGADPNVATIQDLGVTSLETIEAIAPSYLWRFRPHGQFQTRQTA
jgi:NADH dehydrogenase